MSPPASNPSGPERLPCHEGSSSTPLAGEASLCNQARRASPPQDDRDQQTLPHRPPRSCSPGEQGVPGGVTEPLCTLGCPPLPPAWVVMAARQCTPRGWLAPMFHPSPPVTVTQEAPGRQAWREGVISDAVPYGGFQSHRGGIRLPFPPSTSSSTYHLKRDKCQTPPDTTGRPKPPWYIPPSLSTPFPWRTLLPALHPAGVAAPSPMDTGMGLSMPRCAVPSQAVPSGAAH